LLLGEPTGEGSARWTSAGHSAVYFSRICPASPVKLRLCEPGENGSVLSNYATFDEVQAYEWNVVPLNVFLYGVEDENDRPIFASPGLRQTLQDRFRERSLGDICPGPPCSVSPRANWRDMVAATFAREVYLFEVKTTLEQDLSLIEKFNSIPNVSHYNGVTQNCADFARFVINTYFPKAARPDHINDFFITSPKAISKSFSRYAKRHPELQFYVRRFAQIPGAFKQSTDCRKGTEVLFRSKKWLFPMLLKSQGLALVVLSYTLTGRFNPEHELRRRPSERVAEVEQEIAEARAEKDQDRVRALKLQQVQERAANMGTREEWLRYTAELDRLIWQAVEKGLIEDRTSLHGMFRRLQQQGSAFVDRDGAVWLDLPEGERSRRVGVSASNIGARGSDVNLAYTILLARLEHIVNSPVKDRELMPQFKADWALLQQARARLDWMDQDEMKVASQAEADEQN
jgi:hypothetical protein